VKVQVPANATRARVVVNPGKLTDGVKVASLDQMVDVEK
jgi:ABC-type ATPase with predicted acetyltransferase domain